MGGSLRGRHGRTSRPAQIAGVEPTAASNLNNLAEVLRSQGDLDGARALHERALRIRETHLGSDHPDTARSRQRLAEVVAALETRRHPSA